ncbi:hypothetical protein [Staphylococcus warneri]|mgnify:FL=1|uniref:hypothetical protein n=1 Tax=Staphylococcus warneri TaxID=1292 RepID=UPI001A8D7F8A|nr:hypothetical protein [Staphylococcus warneri]MBO0377066.1 hypothetical protein [Staphylococcus warneri]MCR1798150.1 hypothetical protein [Staphylococcus warneri]HCU8763833.1 hypothetical protein [Staphylococcus aureus]
MVKDIEIQSLKDKIKISLEFEESIDRVAQQPYLSKADKGVKKKLIHELNSKIADELIEFMEENQIEFLHPTIVNKDIVKAVKEDMENKER